MEQRRCLGCMKLTDQPVCPHCGYPLGATNEPHQLAVGSVLRDQYLVGRVLGQGGFGITYLGWDLDLERIVAIKEFFPSASVNRDINVSQVVRVNTTHVVASFESSRERFLREARALAKLGEIPEIVGIYSCFRENNTAYIVMEFVKGTELAKFVQMRGGRMGAQETLKILKNVIIALDTVHKAGLVHRDISPDNIILHPTGGAKILDFGAVRAVENPEVDKELNKSTEAIVKHGFAPVEQYRNRGGIGPWTDEYAMCGTIYYCLTGRIPPDAVSRSMGEESPDWQSIPGLTPRQRAALEKGMSLLAKDRFPSVAELAAELYAEEEAPTAPAPQPEAKPEPVPVSATRSEAVFVPQTAAQPAPVFVSQTASQPAPASAPQPAPAPQSVPVVQRAVKVKKPVNKKLVGIIAGCGGLAAVVAAVLIFFLTSGLVLTPFVSGDGSRTLKRDPLSAYDIATIESVTFQDTLSGAPLLAKDVSMLSDKSVLMWKEGNDVFIAANGKIDAGSSCSSMFMNCTALEMVTFDGSLDTSNTQSFTSMFSGCANLTLVDLEELDTSYGHSFTSMFQGCKSLTQMGIGQWDMSKAQNLDHMFQDCTSLETVPVGGWDVSSAKDMYRMFMNCSSITELYAESWNTANVTDMCSLFNGCSSLTHVYVGSWNTANVTNMASMFANCTSLTTVNISRWDAGKVESIAFMFQNCTSMTGFDAPAWNLSIIQNYEGYLDEDWTIGGIPWEDWFLQNMY